MWLTSASALLTDRASAHLGTVLLHDLEPLVQQLLILHPGQLQCQCSNRMYGCIRHIGFSVFVNLHHPKLLETHHSLPTSTVFSAVCASFVLDTRCKSQAYAKAYADWQISDNSWASYCRTQV